MLKAPKGGLIGGVLFLIWIYNEHYDGDFGKAAFPRDCLVGQPNGLSVEWALWRRGVIGR